jgi:hypothetical protein
VPDVDGDDTTAFATDRPGCFRMMSHMALRCALLTDTPTPESRPRRAFPGVHTKTVCTYRGGMVTETAGEVSLTDVERRLVDHVTRGELLDLAAAEPVNEAAMRTWNSSRTIRAAVLRDILRGRLAPDPDPHGLRLRGARIAGRLDLENLATGVGMKLYDCLLGEGLVAHDATLPALVLSGCRLEHPAQPPLAADRLTATMLVLNRAVITAACEIGAVRLLGAHLGLLDCTGARMRNDTGPALHADRLQVDEGVFLRGGFEAVGAGNDGAVRLAGAHLGRLECDGARIRNDTGRALHADGLQVDQVVFLRGGFEAVGAGNDGAVRLLDAHLGGQLNCIGARMRNDAGPALGADGLQVDQGVFLRGGFEAVGAGSGVTLNLSEVRVGGVLEFAPARLEHTADPQNRLALDGLTYAGLPVSSLDWLDLLRQATPSYAAQPYQQFAAAHRAAGHDGEVRKILMAQRKAQIDRRALTGRGERAWARLTGVTLGYGYRPWRALLFLLAVATIAAVLAFYLGAHGGVARTNPHPAAATRCSAVERVGVGLDLGLPLVKTGTRAHCDTTASTTGQALTLAGWGLQLLAWAFATLFVAGFTGIVRKT